jgi:hypothetical protein
MAVINAITSRRERSSGRRARKAARQTPGRLQTPMNMLGIEQGSTFLTMLKVAGRS